MVGYPKHLNSRADYDYVRQNFPAEQWLPSYKSLLTNTEEWFFTKNLNSKAEGIEDDTHKIIVNTTTAAEGEEAVETYAQYELRVNENAKIFRMGFTVQEVEAIIAAAENN